jgi:hypothetical protein
MAEDGLKKKKKKIIKIIKKTTDKDGNKVKLELMKSKSLVPYTSIYEI